MLLSAIVTGTTVDEEPFDMVAAPVNAVYSEPANAVPLVVA